ncbi:unnamed protein product [Prorocentrum cordatum]|uniref:Uncharacterized protein n=1 Tax=Prorocentrum cordatum TaxID=2364126 RepID=A0ABN9Q5X3_9DINO|nr:unnamed protein product [Polarella glacialis]
MASAATPPSAPATPSAGVADLLGPPLDVLPRSIEPQDLHDYRVDYQAFRSGQAQGARGELADLRTRPPHSAAPPPRSHEDHRRGQERQGPGAQARDRTTSSVECYYSRTRAAQHARRRRRRGPWAGAHRLAGLAGELPRSSSQASRAAPPAAAAAASRPGWRGRCGAGCDPTVRRWRRGRCRPATCWRWRRCRAASRSCWVSASSSDILLHELSFTPLSALRACLRFLARKRLRTTELEEEQEQCDLLRVSLLLLNVALVHVLFDTSWVYHFIRGQSFLKLYVSFNMLEMFERWCRSVGVDLINLLMTSMRDPWFRLLRTFALTLFCCLVHTTMHLLRVLLYHVAINTSSSAVLLIIVTNSAGEVKSTVFKRYKSDNLFPIITSDIVERFYLVLDIVCLLVRLAVSPHAQMQGVTFWISLDRPARAPGTGHRLAEVLPHHEVQRASRLHAGSVQGGAGRRRAAVPLRPAAERAPPRRPRRGQCPELPGDVRRPLLQPRASAAHRLQRRRPALTSMIVLHLATLLRSPCALRLRWPAVAGLAGCVLLLAFLAKVLLGLCLLGFAARRRQTIRRGLELFGRVKAL